MSASSHETPRQVRWVGMAAGCVIEEWIPQLCSSHPDQPGSLAALILDPGPAEVCTSHHYAASMRLWVCSLGVFYGDGDVLIDDWWRTA